MDFNSNYGQTLKTIGTYGALGCLWGALTHQPILLTGATLTAMGVTNMVSNIFIDSLNDICKWKYSTYLCTKGVSNAVISTGMTAITTGFFGIGRLEAVLVGGFIAGQLVSSTYESFKQAQYFNDAHIETETLKRFKYVNDSDYNKKFPVLPLTDQRKLLLCNHTMYDSPLGKNVDDPLLFGVNITF